MKKITYLLLICALPLCVIAQSFNENFAGTLAQWTNTNDFSIVGSELRLTAAAAGTSYITAAVQLQDSTSWEFAFHIDISTGVSGSNYARIVLQSDAANIGGDFNGYYIQVGESNGDSLKLYRKQGATSTLIMRTPTPLAAANPKARVRVTRNAQGGWVLAADYAGGTTFLPQGSVTDATFLSGNFFGFVCGYTSTNVQKFFFDNVTISPIIIDTAPPVVTGVTVQNATTLNVQFNESLQLAAASDPTNYSLNNGATVQSATLVGGNGGTWVALTVSAPLTSGTPYILTVTGVKDVAGNACTAQTKTVTYYALSNAAEFDVLVSEIMADPTPQVGLPNVEFVELYNRTANKNIDLSTLSLKLGNSAAQPLMGILLANSYVVVCKTGSESLLSSYGTVIGVPSFGLTNGGDSIMVYQGAVLLHKVAYKDTWYRSTAKKDGGYTLELINPSKPCAGSQNWIASNAAAGGTPAHQNSVYTNTPDTQAPAITMATATSSTTLQVLVSEPYYGGAVLSTNNYSINNGIGFPTTVIAESDTSLVLTFATAFPANTNLTLTTTNLTDCSGNMAATQSKIFSYLPTVSPTRYDLIINELLADPSNQIGNIPAQEYVEIYNRSANNIQLQDVRLLSGSSGCTLPFYVMPPNTYVILTSTDAGDFSSFGTNFHLASFPALSNPTTTSGDDLRLEAPNATIIDAVQYDKTYWKGVVTTKALERINPNRPCDGADNWHGSTSPNGGTPAAANSVLQTTADTDAPQLIRAFAAPSNPTLVTLYFSEAMLNNNAVLDTNNFTISGGIGKPLSVALNNLYGNTATLILRKPLQLSIIYNITLTANVKDCVGNAIGTDTRTATVVLPAQATKNDLVFNEILAHPKSGVPQFLELYNRSQKVIDLSTVIVAARSSDTTSRIPLNYLLFPGDYVVLTESKYGLTQNYNVSNPEKVIQMSLPQMSISADRVFLLSNGNIIDSLSYTADWQTKLLDPTNGDTGISLERISPDRATNDANNWHSAAQTVGFATPTYRNSQFYEGGASGTAVTVLPEVFSPDGDGYNDFTQVLLHSDKAMLTTIKIYDVQGREVAQLANNELLGTNDAITWDGAMTSGSKAATGIYVVWISAFSESGDIINTKKTVVLASKL
jgi:hypothetical protein